MWPGDGQALASTTLGNWSRIPEWLWRSLSSNVATARSALLKRCSSLRPRTARPGSSPPCGPIRAGLPRPGAARYLLLGHMSGE